MTPGYISG